MSLKVLDFIPPKAVAILGIVEICWFILTIYVVILK